MKKYTKFYLSNTFFNLVLLLFSPLLQASYNFKSFQNLSGDELSNNSAILKEKIIAVYEKIKGNLQDDCYFIRPQKCELYSSDDEENSKLGKNFDIYGINLCTAGIQWLIKNQDNSVSITDFHILKNEKNRIPIFSSSQTKQWNENIIRIKDVEYQLLSWPYTAKKEPYTFEYFDEKSGEIIGNDGIVNNSLEFFTIENDLNDELWEILPNACNKLSEYANKRNNIDTDDLDTWKESIIKITHADLNHIKNKYCNALDIEENEYVSLFEEEKDPVMFLTKKLASELINEHSEPLFCWWIDKNKERLIKSLGNLSVEKLIPILYVYTFRQTCHECENSIQSLAYENYAPIISFTDEFINFGLEYSEVEGKLIGCKGDPFNTSTCLPHIKLKENNISLTFDKIEKILYTKAPFTGEKIRYPIQFQIGNNV